MPSEPAILKLISEGVDAVVFPVVQLDLDVDDRPAVDPAGAHGLSMPFCTAGMNWRGMAPPTI